MLLERDRGPVLTEAETRLMERYEDKGPNGYSSLTEKQRTDFRLLYAKVVTRKLLDQTDLNYEAFAGMSREQMLDKMQFLSEDSGYGYGLMGAFGAVMFAAAGPRPKAWKSWPLFTFETQTLATYEELRWIYAWTEAYNAKMDKTLGSFRHSNSPMIIGVKGEGYRRFFHKRQSWEYGRFYSDTLSEAVVFLSEVVS